jgi:hypothetical protein
MPAELTSSYYAHRLAAVHAALREAEAAGRYGEVEALRLAEDVLAELICEKVDALAQVCGPTAAYR